MEHIVEINEEGDLVLTPELLLEYFGYSPPHTRYIVETRGNTCTVQREALPGGTQELPDKPNYEKWETAWQETQEKVSKVWPEGASATEIISEMRR